MKGFSFVLIFTVAVPLIGLFIGLLIASIFMTYPFALIVAIFSAVSLIAVLFATRNAIRFIDDE
ncbi:hypothetical protein FACS189487_07060 [Campylobacterota bacterium]|nr:hypothetical protein FACS189487_07060 [Campylobacterota bacterium]